MSKTDTPLGPLVGILKFDLPAKSTRTLSATQAYDTFRSQIVLGSFTGKFTDKTATEKADGYELLGGTFNTSQAWHNYAGAGGAGAKRNDAIAVRMAGTISLSATSSGRLASPIIFTSSPDGVTYSGARPLDQGSSFMSKATNANTTYYGAITVGLGKYKKWQGNYAVLKINTVTEKAVLRIYAD